MVLSRQKLVRTISEPHNVNIVSTIERESHNKGLHISRYYGGILWNYMMPLCESTMVA
jgi:hypothetical protein